MTLGKFTCNYWHIQQLSCQKFGWFLTITLEIWPHLCLSYLGTQRKKQHFSNNSEILKKHELSSLIGTMPQLDLNGTLPQSNVPIRLEGDILPQSFLIFDYDASPDKLTHVMWILFISITALDGGWSHWDSWGSCQKRTRSRHRNCTDPTPKGKGKPCSGNGTQETSCEGTFQYLNPYYPRG